MIVLDDVRELAHEIHNKFWKRYKAVEARRITLRHVATENLKLDSSGAGNLIIFKNTSGRHAVFGRVVLLADGYTPATIYQATAAYAYLYAGTQLNMSNIYDFLPNVPGGQLFPQVAEYSGHNAIRLEQNESLSLYVVGGPASTNITAILYGALEPTSTDFDI